MRVCRLGMWFYLVASLAWGWGETGHRAVGLIAAKKLSERARARVAEILRVENSPAAVADAMATGSYWADAVARKLYPQASPWHYINLSLLNGAGDVPDPFASPNTVYAKIVQYAETVRDRRADEFEPGSDLKFLLHFVGDLHQPLHAAANQDQGGNCVEIPEFRNLHAAWDTGLLERALGNDPAALAARLARRPVRDGRAEGDLRSLVRRWAMESHNIAKAKVYAPLRPRLPRVGARAMASCDEKPDFLRGKTWTLDERYIQRAGGLIEGRLALAGARLAALLERIL